VAEQRYQAVLAVISDGLSVSQVAPKFGVSRQTLHSWLARYEEAGLLSDSFILVDDGIQDLVGDVTGQGDQVMGVVAGQQAVDAHSLPPQERSGCAARRPGVRPGFAGTGRGRL
jgi:transposase